MKQVIGGFRAEAWHHPSHLLTAHAGCCDGNRTPGFRAGNSKGLLWTVPGRYTLETTTSPESLASSGKKKHRLNPILNFVNSFVLTKPYAGDVTSTGLQISPAVCCPIPEDTAPAPRSLCRDIGLGFPPGDGCSPGSQLVFLFFALFIVLCLPTCFCWQTVYLCLARVQGHMAAASIFSYPYSHIPHRKESFYSCLLLWVTFRAVSYKQAIQDANASLKEKKKEIHFEVYDICILFLFPWVEKNISACTHWIFRMKPSVANAWLKNPYALDGFQCCQPISTQSF